ncbi:MAG: hypothetical protein IKE55_03120 [Kiritimatiellae bacterium]|nr:hypothetical protein [Kiritimatiellia bacterium]
MKKLLCLLPLCLSTGAGAGVAVGPLPQADFADTEVSTNLAFAAGDNHVVEMTFALHGECVSNCLQVAFGRDADCDGILGPDESEALFGWRNGRCFAENAPEGIRVEEAADDVGATSRVFTAGFRISRARGLRRFAVVGEDGAAVFTNLSASAEGWPCRIVWDTMRVTRRGPGVPDEWFSCDVRPGYFVLRLR